MRRRIASTALAVSCLILLGACGIGSHAAKSGDATGPGNDAGAGLPAAAPGTGGAKLIVDPDHRYRVINLHSFNGQPGGSLDVYPTIASNLDQLGSGVTPLVSGLAYGQASDALPPGGVPSAFGMPSYGLGILPHDPNATGSANLKFDVNSSSQSKPWKHATVVLGGTGNGLQSQTFYDSTGPDEPNGVPAVVPGKLAVLVSAEYAGDPHGNDAIIGALLAGTSAGCLKAVNDGSTQPATAVNQSLASYLTLDAGTTSLGFWVAADAGGACTGAPAFSVSLPAAGADGRVAVFVYGPDSRHLAGIAVPIDG